MRGPHACAVALLIAFALMTGCSGRSAGDGQAGAANAELLPRLPVSALDGTGSGGSFATLELRDGVAPAPSSLPVYRVLDPGASSEKAAALAQKVGVRGSATESDRDFRVADADGERFFLDKSTGSFVYMTPAFEDQTEPLESTLTDAEYRGLAEEFLNTTGLMPQEAEFRDVNRDNVVGRTVGGKVIERPYMIEVRFSHKPLAGVRFDAGVGPKVIVQFGENGRIIGAMSVWRDVEPVKAYPLVSIDQAVDQIKANNAETYDVAPGANGIIETMELSYISDPLGYQQEFVIPYFIAKGRDAQGRSFTSLTRAIPEQYLAIKPQAESVAPLTPRK